MSKKEEILAIVKRGDAYEIECARDMIKPEDMDDLIEMYWELDSWDDKSGLMQLFSDNLAPQARDVMLDFLKAPTTEINDEYYTSGKVVALCQLEGSYKNFERYWYNRPVCKAMIERCLQGETPSEDLLREIEAQLGVESPPEPEPKLTPKNSKKWWQFWKK